MEVWGEGCRERVKRPSMGEFWTTPATPTPTTTTPSSTTFKFSCLITFSMSVPPSTHSFYYDEVTQIYTIMLLSSIPLLLFLFLILLPPLLLLIRSLRPSNFIHLIKCRARERGGRFSLKPFIPLSTECQLLLLTTLQNFWWTGQVQANTWTRFLPADHQVLRTWLLILPAGRGW